LISLKPVVPGLLLVTACGASTPKAPRGEVSSGKPCDEVIPDCRARRLANVVLRIGAADGSLFSVDGLDTSGVLTFDEALHAAWKNDFRGESDTVQVILGAADVWGTEAGLYYAVKWGGVCAVDSGPADDVSASPYSCDRVWGTVIDAHTGEFVVSGM
jgi:hypothetical protein